LTVRSHHSLLQLLTLRVRGLVLARLQAKVAILYDLLLPPLLFIIDIQKRPLVIGAGHLLLLLHQICTPAPLTADALA